MIIIINHYYGIIFDIVGYAPIISTDSKVYYALISEIPIEIDYIYKNFTQSIFKLSPGILLR